MHNGNFKVVGIENDGTLICKTEDGEIYNCGLTISEFGMADLSREEREAINVLEFSDLFKGSLFRVYPNGPTVYQKAAVDIARRWYVDAKPEYMVASLLVQRVR